MPRVTWQWLGNALTIAQQWEFCKGVTGGKHDGLSRLVLLVFWPHHKQ